MPAIEIAMPASFSTVRRSRIQTAATIAEKMGEVALRIAAVEASIVFTAVPMSQKGIATPTTPSTR